MESRLSLGQFFGQIKTSRRIADSLLTETVYRSGFRIPRHCHDHAYLCFVLQGVLAESYGRESRIRETSSLAFHPPGEVHFGTFDNGAGRLFSVQIDPQWMQRVWQTFASVGSVDFSAGEAVRAARGLYREFRHFDHASSLAIEGLLLEILAEVSRRSTYQPKGSPPRWLEQAKELLQSEFSESPSLAGIAEVVGVHPVHLAAAFRKHYHCTVGEYLRRLRIEFACHKLSTSDEPLSMIAAAAGFSDQSHFSRTFKLMVGVSPLQYKRQIRSA